MVIPHQANYRITETVQKHLGVDQDKVFQIFITMEIQQQHPLVLL